MARALLVEDQIKAIAACRFDGIDPQMWADLWGVPLRVVQDVLSYRTHRELSNEVFEHLDRCAAARQGGPWE